MHDPVAKLAQLGVQPSSVTLNPDSVAAYRVFIARLDKRARRRARMRLKKQRGWA